MHNFIKIAALFPVAVCILAACSEDVRIETLDKSYSTDTIFADAKIPQLSGLSDKAFEEQINDEYEETIEELLSDFSETARETGDKSTFSTETTEHRNKDGVFSAVTQIETCTRNTRLRSYRITKNIDTRLCREIPLSELFSDESYIDMINARLKDTVEADREKYSGLWAEPRLCENQDYYINEESLVLYYPPYELSYYERGFVEIPLPLADMSGYFKPEYRKSLLG